MNIVEIMRKGLYIVLKTLEDQPLGLFFPPLYQEKNNHMLLQLFLVKMKLDRPTWSIPLSLLI